MSIAHRTPRGIGWWLRLGVILIACIAGTHVASAAEQEVLLNPDLSKGSGNSPDHWRTEGWIQKPETTSYAWVHTSGPGELQITSNQPNDARWMQTVSLAGGWYYFSAEIRSEN